MSFMIDLRCAALNLAHPRVTPYAAAEQTADEIAAAILKIPVPTEEGP